jgi:hypothetical protein
MMAQRRSHRPALLLLVATAAAAAALYGAADLAHRAHGPPARSVHHASPALPKALEPGATMRYGPSMAGRGVCVTRHGLCQAPIARAGDPCSCPHPLRGSVPGHLERLGAAAPARSRSSDWPAEEPAEDEIHGWDRLVGP